MSKKLAALGLTAGLAGGSVAAFTLLSPSSSSAQSTTATTAAPTTAAPSSTPTTAPGAKTSRLDAALAPLVANGTITQAQADAVKKAILGTQPTAPNGPNGHQGRGPGFGPGAGLRGEGDAIAKVLGMTTADLQTALRSGQSLADIATSKNVAVQKVIDQIVADGTTRINAAVTAGRLTRTEGDSRIAQLKTEATQIVNAKPGTNTGGRRFGGGFGGGGNAPGRYSGGFGRTGNSNTTSGFERT